MAWVISAVIFFYLGYKCKTLVEFLNMLKIKNYCKYYVERMEDSNFSIVNLEKYKKRSEIND